MDSSGKNITINITTGTFIRAILLGVLLVLLYMLSDIVAVVLFSVVIASGVDPAARWFQKFRMPRALSVIFVYLIAFLSLSLIFYLIVPTMFSELSNLSKNLPLYSDKPFEIGVIADIFPKLPESATSVLRDIAINAEEYIRGFMGGFLNTIATIFGGMFSSILIIIISFYLSVQEKGIENFIRAVTPIQHEKYVISLLLRSRRKIGKWLQGQILLGVLVGVLVYLGLTILGVPYALIFALLAGVFELIPIFGPIMASIPPIVIAFLLDPKLGLMVLALYFLIQQFENHLIYPLVVSKIVGVPPILTILALIIGANLYGFFGILLAIPVATILVEILSDIEKKKRVS